ncbi:hypothetical protein BJ742DRAFT_880894 [Cladochytrium replicatum]|nr:hypothetical protein BJ742DRAFT_880894 [Cladochytrium replicatum]
MIFIHPLSLQIPFSAGKPSKPAGREKVGTPEQTKSMQHLEPSPSKVIVKHLTISHTHHKPLRIRVIPPVRHPDLFEVGVEVPLNGRNGSVAVAPSQLIHPGGSARVAVRFFADRMARECVYIGDEIAFACEDGSHWQVPLHAYPSVAIQIPHVLRFPNTPVGQSTTRALKIQLEPAHTPFRFEYTLELFVVGDAESVNSGSSIFKLEHTHGVIGASSEHGDDEMEEGGMQGEAWVDVNYTPKTRSTAVAHVAVSIAGFEAERKFCRLEAIP